MTTIEKVLGSFTMLTGTIVTAVIVSQVSVLMNSLQAAERQYVNKLSQVYTSLVTCLSAPASSRACPHRPSHAPICTALVTRLSAPASSRVYLRRPADVK